jgi:ATP-dependent RNA helicase DDX31/DBP7
MKYFFVTPCQYTFSNMEAAGGFEGLLPTLTKALQESFNITVPTPIQGEAIPSLLQNSGDVVMQAQTGSGKTLAYALPLLNLILNTYNPNSSTDTSSYREEIGTVGLVIVPTRELAAQTQASLTKVLSRVRPHWIVTTALTGGDSRKSEKARLRRGCQIVVGTPGRLLDHLRTSEGWKRSKLSWLVVDEADRLADLGFENTVKEIFSALSMVLPRLRMVLVSATVTEKLKVEFAGRQLKNPRFIKAGPKKEIYEEESNADGAGADAAADSKPVTTSDSDFNAPVAIDQAYLHTPTKLRLQILVGLLRSFFPTSSTSQSCRVIVFFSCCDSVDFHFELFKTAGENKTIPAFLPPRVKLLRLHGNLEQSNRVSTFNEFIKEGKSSDPVHTVLFCTDVAARGLDFPNLAGSVQYDAPCDIHDYIHRAGRTGRLSASKSASLESTKAKSIIFLMPSEEAYVPRLANMGMKSLHKESFDEYLKWVEKLDAKKLQSVLAAANKKTSRKKEEGDEGEVDSVVAALPSTLKSRLGLLQKVIEIGILGSETLAAKARDGFLSTCRAYATHPAAEKDIFHIKRLHLGHLAAAFGLDREPKKMLAGHLQQRNQNNNKFKSSRDEIPEEIAQGSSKIRKEMRDKQRYQTQQQQQQQHSDQYNNRLNFNSKNSQKRANDAKPSQSITSKKLHYEDDSDGEVIFAY